ncbi:MAG: hypothetical protein ACF8GE_11090 [Phycisphaerales bacterium JB043]
MSPEMGSRTRHTMLALACASAVTLASASAQQLRPVEAGVDDIGTLRTSGRVQMHDLRVASDFDRVYQLDDGTRRYVRIHGAIRAVFPRSSYDLRRGTPTVPAGTIFYLGAPDAWSIAQETNPILRPGRLNARHDSRVSSRVDGRVTGRAPSQMVGGRSRSTVWSDEAYRQRRMGELLLGDAP